MSKSRQRGIASLVVVAVLFFIVSMVAAYTNRNLIFEQRTSTNQYRSTLAFEAAEAGLEWALAMLNGGRIDENCAASTDVADNTFRQRYLGIDDNTGRVLPTGTLAADGGGTVWPSCVFDGANWDCSCPDPGSAPSVSAPAADSLPHPAFRIRFTRLGNSGAGAPPPPGAVRIDVNGCTRLADACLNFPSDSVSGEGRAVLQVVVALRGGVAAPPIAPLTVRQTLTVGGALTVYNSTASEGGLTVMTGQPISDPSGTLVTTSAPGAPPNSGRVESDAGLQALTGERLFTSTFATWRDAWRDQPAARRLDCTASACDGNDLRNAIAHHPGHIVYVDGDIVLDGAGDIGSATTPVMLVVDNGSVTGIDAGTTLWGMLYVRDADWAASGSGTVRGAVMAENAMSGTAAFTIAYDADVIRRLRWQTGSFVRVPGGWRDF